MRLKKNILADNRLTELGSDVHWVRVSNNEDIFTAARRLNVPYEELEDLETGFSGTLDVDFLRRFAETYDEKIFIGLGEDYV